LNLFEANHYQIIDAERYRTEDQFYPKPVKTPKDDKSDSSQTNNTENWQSTPGENWNSAIESLDIQNHEINNETVDTKNLDNDQQNVINNQDIWLDLSGHEINDSWDFKLEL